MTFGKFVFSDIQYGRCSRVADSCGSAAEVYSEKYAEKYALYFVGICGDTAELPQSMCIAVNLLVSSSLLGGLLDVLQRPGYSCVRGS